MESTDDPERVPSGTPGLDEVLDGGFIRGQTAMLSGGPGTGKTLMALQFLAAGDGGLYIGFEEREADLRRNAGALGIDLSNVAVLDLSAGGDRFFSEESYRLLPPEEVEGEDLLDEIAAAIDREAPDRLVIDPLSELRALLPDDYQFRRKVSSLINELKERSITTVCTTQYVAGVPETDLHFLGDVTIEVRRRTDRRTLEVTKSRGAGAAGGRHTVRITPDGVRVYPKLVPGDYLREHSRERLETDVPALNELLGGGIERGSVTVISGPSGVGKTTTANVLLRATAQQGRRSVAYLFEELAADYRYRARELGIGVDELVEEGTLRLEEIESLTQSPDEFAYHVRTAVEEDDVEVVLLDGIAGYRLGLRGEASEEGLTRELHALCRYLKRMGVTVVLIDEVTSVAGELVATNEQISYLADNIVFLRYIEDEGHMSKAIGVLKKRFGGFERTLRPLTIDENGYEVGAPLTGYRGLLTGLSGAPDPG